MPKLCLKQQNTISAKFQESLDMRTPYISVVFSANNVACLLPNSGNSFKNMKIHRRRLIKQPPPIENPFCMIFLIFIFGACKSAIWHYIPSITILAFAFLYDNAFVLPNTSVGQLLSKVLPSHRRILPIFFQLRY